MSNFLTTEELLRLLKKQEQAFVPKVQKEPKKQKKSNRKIKRVIFFIFLGIASLHAVFTSLAFFLPETALNMLGSKYVLAVPNDQEIDEELYTDIYLMQPFRISRLTTNDRILIYGKYQTSVYWIEEVIDINLEQRTIDTTFDGFIRNTYAFDDIAGIVNQKANLVGVIFYVSTTPRGYVALIMTYIVVLTITHQLFIKENKKNKPSR